MDIDHAAPPDERRSLDGRVASLPRRGSRLTALGVAALTLASWGGRIGLLAAAPTATDVVRIGGSLLVGLVTAAVLVRRGAVPTMIALTFVGWNLAVWGRAAVVTWIDAPSLGFAMVHTALAIAWAAACWAVWRHRADPRHRP